MSDVELTVEALSSLLSGMQEPCMVVDERARVVVANAAARESFEPGMFDDSPRLVGVLGAGDETDTATPGPDAVERLLGHAWRSGRAVPMTAVAGTPRRRWRCEAWRLGLDARGVALPFLVVQLRPHGRAVERFALLESQLQALNREVHEHRRTETRLRETNRTLATIFGSAPIGMAVADADIGGAAVVTRANSALGRLAGRDHSRLPGISLSDLIVDDDRPSVAATVARLVANPSSTAHFDATVRHVSGERIPVSISASALHDDPSTTDDLGIAVVLQFVDLTERRRYETQLRYLADHDALTGLLNRRRFADAVADAVERAQRRGDLSTVVLIDLDNFTGVNDAYGHASGDELIAVIARSVERRLRFGDVISRFGGDEFAILLPDTDLATARHLAEAIRRDVLSTSAIDGEGRTVSTSISAAVVLVDGSSDAEYVFAAADQAMYETKSAGGDRVGVADPTHSGLTAQQSDHRWQQKIRDALAGDLFELHAQPILDLRTGTTTRFELLLRLRDGDELVTPGTFLGVAERSGLIQSIDRWVVARAVDLLATWQADASSAAAKRGVTVNLSGATITDDDAVAAIEAHIDRAGIDARRLMFELTETAAISNMERAREVAERLASRGCRFALDDVGTGFGSFYYLKHLPADVIKIDGDYVRDLPENHVDQLIVRAVVDIARGTGREVVAEWVDRAEIVDLVAEYGVDYAQGYHIGRPVPLDQLDAVRSLPAPGR